jgi:O-6-methylguanine DNA methyltransferase
MKQPAADNNPRWVACRAATLFGTITALYQDDVIHRVLFPNESMGSGYDQFDDTLPFAVQLTEYFSGKRLSFDLPMLLPGTPFRQAVYAATLHIPYGHTATYGDVALTAGHPNAMRAVGTTMRLNPLPILIPCHRVVHKSLSRQAYSGGLDMKNALLKLEADNG